VLRLGRHVVSGRDARLLVEHLGEVQEHLALDAARLSAADKPTGELCEAARARVTEDLELVAAALERAYSPSWT
jgi:hypothetical protein